MGENGQLAQNVDDNTAAGHRGNNDDAEMGLRRIESTNELRLAN